MSSNFLHSEFDEKLLNLMKKKRHYYKTFYHLSKKYVLLRLTKKYFSKFSRNANIIRKQNIFSQKSLLPVSLILILLKLPIIAKSMTIFTK